jgi:hypothetical protein
MRSRKSDNAGFVTRRFKTKLNAPPISIPWVWMTHEFLESGAYRALSIHGVRALNRIQLEHMAHGGLENGRLKVAWHDFRKYGISGPYILQAEEELIALGIVVRERRGRKCHGEDHGDPAQWRLTYLPVSEPANTKPATNEWKRFGTSISAAKNVLKKLSYRKQISVFKGRYRGKTKLSLVPKKNGPKSE